MSDFEFIVPLLSLVDSSYTPQTALIEAHLKWLKSYGAQGILILGTTGEFPNFSVSQRQCYLETVLSVNPGLKVMINIGAAAMPDVFELLHHAEAQPGVEQILWMPPFYFPDNQFESLDATLTALLEQRRSKIPLYLYHHPKMSQVAITPELLGRFPQLAGIKDSFGDFERIGQLVRDFPRMQIYVGTDYRIQQSKALGSAGIITGLGNIFPQFTQKALNGDSQAETTLQQLRKALDTYGKLPALKAILNHLGLSPEKTVSTLPFTDLPEAKTRQLIEQIERISSEACTNAN